jgi:hypothetical protein
MKTEENIMNWKDIVSSYNIKTVSVTGSSLFVNGELVCIYKYEKVAKEVAKKIEQFKGVKDKTYRREFESTEAIVIVETNDYKKFKVYKEEYIDMVTTKPKEYAGSFTAEDIEGAINSEKKISNFIADKFNLSNVYSVNDFTLVVKEEI